MASGGSSGRASSGPRSFDFGSDDVLCSYDDFANHDTSASKRPDPSAKEYHENKVRPLANVYGQQDEYPKEEVISAVEKCMKKYADNLLRHLEGISGRLSQLEVYCYKLERSIGEFRADMIRDHGEADTKLKSLEKHLQEVHRSIQILRDKQELTETQKELSNLQVAQKESASQPRPQKNEEVHAPSSLSDTKRHDEVQEAPTQHLALALPHQLPTTRVPEQPYMQQQQQQQQSAPTSNERYMLSQTPPYYPPQSQAMQHELHYVQSRPQAPPSIQQNQALQPELQYMQSRPQAPPAPQNQALQPELHYIQARPQVPPPASQQQPQQPFPQYQQQWPQSSPQQFAQQLAVAARPPTSQPQLIRSQTPPTYPETFTYNTMPQPGGTRSEAAGFSYVQPPPPPSKASSGYLSMSPYPQQPNMQGYTAVYGMDSSRVQNFQQESYPPPNSAMRPHPYSDIIEKAMSMGYPRDQVVGVLNRMGESGQTIDFNSLLDRLNSHPASGGPPRAWSG